MSQPTAILENAMYTRADLVAIYGARMANRICKAARKVARGKYMGFHVLAALQRLADELELQANQEVTRATGGLKGFCNGSIQKGRTPW